MRRSDLTITEPSAFGAPIFSAIIVHVVVAVLLLSSWNFSVNQPDAFELPKNIRAEFVQIEQAKPEPEVVEPLVNPKPPVRETPKPVETPKSLPPKPEPVVAKPEPIPQVKAPEPVIEQPTPEPEAINISQEPEPRIVEQQPDPVEETTISKPEEDLFGDLLAGLAAEEQAISNKIEEITQSQIRAAQIQSEINNYQRTITAQIEEKWSRPVELRLMDLSSIEAVVAVEILPTGELQKATIARSSGNTNYDQSVLRAIEKVRRFSVPDDPELFEAGGFRNLNITFRPEDLMKS